MGGDYSRHRQDPEHRVSATWLQQGRVLLDADWNEHAQAADRRARTAVIDTLNAQPGQCVVPAATPDAFKVAIDSAGALTLGSGRAYLDGMLVENRGDPA